LGSQDIQKKKVFGEKKGQSLGGKEREQKPVEWGKRGRTPPRGKKRKKKNISPQKKNGRIKKKDRRGRGVGMVKNRVKATDRGQEKLGHKVPKEEEG